MEGIFYFSYSILRRMNLRIDVIKSSNYNYDSHY